MPKPKKEKQKTTDQLLEEISSKLNYIIYMIGSEVFKEGTQKDHIKRLKKAGYSNKEIALMLGTTPKTVSVALTPSQSRTKRK